MTLEAAKEFKLEMERALVAYATQIVIDAVDARDMKEPEGLIRTCSVRTVSYTHLTLPTKA